MTARASLSLISRWRGIGTCNPSSSHISCCAPWRSSVQRNPCRAAATRIDLSRVTRFSTSVYQTRQDSVYRERQITAAADFMRAVVRFPLDWWAATPA